MHQSKAFVTHSSLDTPIAWKESSNPDVFLYGCGKCLQVVSIHARTPEQAMPVFRRHQAGKRCRDAFEQGTWMLSALSRPPSRSFTPYEGALESPPPHCPGIPLVWPGHDFFGTYPWHQHDPQSHCRLPWRFPIFDESSGTFYVRSRTCSLLPDRTGSACIQCMLLCVSVDQRHSQATAVPASRTNHLYRNRRQLEELVSEQRREIDAQRLELLALRDTSSHAQEKSRTHERILALLGQHPIARLPRLITVWMRSKGSVISLLERIRAAVKGSYSVQGDFSSRELALGLLVLRLGGARLLFALSTEFGLPSFRTLKRSHIPVRVEPSLCAPDYGDVMSNITSVIVEPHKGKQPSRLGCQIALDETALKPSACYVPHLHSLGGICPCAGLQKEELYIDSDGTLDRLQSMLSPSDGETKQAHYASQATVVALNFLGREQYRALPFLVHGGCGTKDAKGFVNLMKLIIKGYADSTALSCFGWFFSFATDGDSARRKGGFHYLLSCKLDMSSSLGKRLEGLLGMNYMVGPNDITLDFDWKHVMKRTLIFFCTVVTGLKVCARL
jgi:hypothetical protein